MSNSDMSLIAFVATIAERKANYDVFNGTSILITPNEVSYAFQKELDLKYFKRTYK